MKSVTPKKKPPVKAELVKAGVLPHLLSAKMDRYLLPATQEAYDAMVEQGARAVLEDNHPSVNHTEKWWAAYKRMSPEGWGRAYNHAVYVLKSLGITPPTK